MKKLLTLPMVINYLCQVLQCANTQFHIEIILQLENNLGFFHWKHSVIVSVIYHYQCGNESISKNVEEYNMSGTKLISYNTVCRTAPAIRVC